MFFYYYLFNCLFIFIFKGSISFHIKIKFETVLSRIENKQTIDTYLNEVKSEIEDILTPEANLFSKTLK